MKKTLVEVANLDAHICKESNALYSDGSLILTPGAKDELRKRGVELVHGEKPQVQACPPGCTCPACAAASSACTDLLVAVAATLKNEYGITDTDELTKASYQIVNALKETI